MGWTDYLTAEVVTAIGVCFGALLGGLASLIKELRQPRKPRGGAPAPEETTPGGDDLLREEFEHLSRTVWIVEQRLSDRLQQIEVQLGALGGGDAR